MGDQFWDLVGQHPSEKARKLAEIQDVLEAAEQAGVLGEAIAEIAAALLPPGVTLDEGATGPRNEIPSTPWITPGNSGLRVPSLGSGGRTGGGGWSGPASGGAVVGPSWLDLVSFDTKGDREPNDEAGEHYSKGQEWAEERRKRMDEEREAQRRRDEAWALYREAVSRQIEAGRRGHEAEPGDPDAGPTGSAAVARRLLPGWLQSSHAPPPLRLTGGPGGDPGPENDSFGGGSSRFRIAPVRGWYDPDEVQASQGRATLGRFARGAPTIGPGPDPSRMGRSATARAIVAQLVGRGLLR